MFTICAYCKRAKHGEVWELEWTDAEIVAVSNVKASHGICPECLAKMKL